MPLIKSSSKKAFGKNVKAELAAGKPLKQSLAIAYSEKRAAAKKKPSAREHSAHTSEMASAYEKSVAHTRQDLNPAKKTRRITKGKL
jgi:hypothetical protein